MLDVGADTVTPPEAITHNQSAIYHFCWDNLKLTVSRHLTWNAAICIACFSCWDAMRTPSTRHCSIVRWPPRETR